MPLVLNGTTGVQDNSGAFVRGTAIASTSGTTIDFTGIPSWVKRVTVMLDQVSTNGATALLVQIGSGSFETTGYAGGYGLYYSTGGAVANSSTTGFGMYFGATGQTATGHVVLTLISGNTWVVSGTLFNTVQPYMTNTAGSRALSGTLDRLRITSVGANTFDNGTINILYE
jgi:hypothetical protein